MHPVVCYSRKIENGTFSTTNIETETNQILQYQQLDLLAQMLMLHVSMFL
jgi:hypothetical protein